MKPFTKLFIHFAIIPLIVESVLLDNTGSYKLVVSIDETTLQNTVPNFIENIQTGIQDLSELLHHATNSKFYIEDVDIVVPSHWDTPADGIAVTQYHSVADIQVSHVHNVPNVDNPISCGHAGNSIQLPYNFFNDTTIYGSSGRALLTLFVRWRYGAWEEHGYPGDSTFPYFWKPLKSNAFHPTSCTDVEIRGKYETTDGVDCTPKDGETPPANCRFFPDAEEPQIATTSLMSYYNVESIKEFCDKTTHVKEAPTPQNLFCKHKSVSEVIENSRDWETVTRPNSLTPTTFNILKTSKSPLLYILLDSGFSQAPSFLLSEISVALSNLVNAFDLQEVVTMVAKYPSETEGQFVTEIVPWTTFFNGRDALLDAFNNTLGNTPGFRDFGGAIAEAARVVNSREHNAGGVVLVVKTGSELNTAAVTSESKVLMQTLTAPINVFAIEIEASQIQPGIALERATTSSEGDHLILNSSTTIRTQLEGFMESLTTTLQTGVKRDALYNVAVNDIVEHAGPVELKLNSGIIHYLGFIEPLIGELGTPIRLVTVPGGGGNERDAPFTSFLEWGTSSTSNTASVFFNTRATELGNPSARIFWDELQYGCTTGDDCTVILHEFVKVADVNDLPNVTLTVTTSAHSGIVDLSLENSATDLGTPFAIYATLKENGMPLKDAPGLSVIAIAFNKNTKELHRFTLVDDGAIVPDIARNDGVFSRAFVPLNNGRFEITVTATFHKPTAIREVAENAVSPFSRSLGKLFPIDQEGGCWSGHLGCWSMEPNFDFVISPALPLSIEFRNVGQFKPMVNRITDLHATPKNGGQLQLTWTDPGVIVPGGGLEKADSYEIKYSDNFDTLVNDFDNAVDLFPPGDNDMPIPGEPGNIQDISVVIGENVDRYFAIRTISSRSGNDAPSPVISNIVGVRIRDVVPSTTSTTPISTGIPITSTTPGPTTSTTLDPALTTPTNSTTIRTTPRTSKPPSSTPVSVTTPKLTTKVPPTPTPRPPPEDDEHWFETTEGIITVSVFGGGILALLALGLLLMKLKSR